MLTLSDEEIILKIRQGEIEHFSLIVKKYTQPIYRFISRRLFNQTEVEDLVQNSFVSFYKSINRFEESRKILPYLYEIAKNELKMYYRSHKNTLPLKEEIVVEEKEDVAYDPLVLNVLDRREKMILLQVAEGYSYTELARKYKISLNTLKSKIRRARLKIKAENEKT